MKLIKRLASISDIYTRLELEQWIERRRDADPDRSDDELVELFRDVHWCPRDQGGVR